MSKLFPSVLHGFTLIVVARVALVPDSGFLSQHDMYNHYAYIQAPCNLQPYNDFHSI